MHSWIATGGSFGFHEIGPGSFEMTEAVLAAYEMPEAALAAFGDQASWAYLYG